MGNVANRRGCAYVGPGMRNQKKSFLERQRERACTHNLGGGGRMDGQRERETQNLKQAPGSELSAQCPKRGSNSKTVRS